MTKVKVMTKKKRDSGIITIRTTSSNHRVLKVIAKKEGVSLNHLISTFLTQKVTHGFTGDKA